MKSTVYTDDKLTVYTDDIVINTDQHDQNLLVWYNDQKIVSMI